MKKRGAGLQFVQHVVNVHWGGPPDFLYSGAEGMFGSKDGETWEEAPSSVPAKSLAWVDNVWVACGDGGSWRSVDGAKTWEAIGQRLDLVVAMKPAGEDETGKPLPGMFAGYGQNAAGDDVVYTSSDGGQSWSVALTFGSLGDAREVVAGLSGCGGAFFVGTVYNVNLYSADTAKVYSSFDGVGFSSQTVATGTFWDGDLETVPAVFVGYSCGGVGYDKKTKTYLATIQKQETPFGIAYTYLQASASITASFNEGVVVDQAIMIAASDGDFLAVSPSVAGGNGAFVGGSGIDHRAGGLGTGGEARAHWLPGGGSGQVLESYPAGIFPERSIGSFCFNPMTTATEETTDSTDEPDTMGVFACVASGAGQAGGVYIAPAGGSFRKTHSGTPWAVAVGKIKFGSTDAGL